jgi:hypothetical protein
MPLGTQPRGSPCGAASANRRLVHRLRPGNYLTQGLPMLLGEGEGRRSEKMADDSLSPRCDPQRRSRRPIVEVSIGSAFLRLLQSQAPPPPILRSLCNGRWRCQRQTQSTFGPSIIGSRELLSFTPAHRSPCGVASRVEGNCGASTHRHTPKAANGGLEPNVVEKVPRFFVDAGLAGKPELITRH